jgi:hypothetical protein
MIYNSQSSFSLRSVNSLPRTPKTADAPQFAGNGKDNNDKDTFISKSSRKPALKSQLGDSGHFATGSNTKKASYTASQVIDEDWIPASNQEHEKILEAERQARRRQNALR